MGDLQNKEQISVIIPSFHSEKLISICIRSFIRFCRPGINLKYFVVENSNDKSYKNNITKMDPNIVWINNNTKLIGSEANAEAIEIGLKEVNTGLVFLCHCDVCVTSVSFFDNIIQKYNEGNKLVGTIIDMHPRRINAFHISGVLVDSVLSKSVKYMPHYKNGVQILDVGDELTDYCRKNNIPHYCFPNTFNSPNLLLSKDYSDFRVARCVNENNEVIFMHLARGIPKTRGTYFKLNRIYLDDWVKFCNGILK